MFGFNLDRRTIYIVLIILLALWITSTGTDGIIGTLIAIPGVLVAITFHEYAHAFAADKLRR